MSVETCDKCSDIDADNYYNCDNCRRHLCERCYGDITLVFCNSCVKDPDEGRAIAEQKRFDPKGKPTLPIVNARWQVRAFAEAMEEVLKKNDHKGGWGKDCCSIHYLQARLIEEIGEYFGLVAKFTDDFPEVSYLAYKDQLQKELVDIANFCMMLWDRG